MALKPATDVRLYTYSGYGVLHKIRENKYHKNKSYTEAIATIKQLRTVGRRFYKNVQYVVIDYTNGKIVHVSDPNIPKDV